MCHRPQVGGLLEGLEAAGQPWEQPPAARCLQQLGGSSSHRSSLHCCWASGTSYVPQITGISSGAPGWRSGKKPLVITGHEHLQCSVLRRNGAAASPGWKPKGSVQRVGQSRVSSTRAYRHPHQKLPSWQMQALENVARRAGGSVNPLITNSCKKVRASYKSNFATELSGASASAPVAGKCRGGEDPRGEFSPPISTLFLLPSPFCLLPSPLCRCLFS